MKDYPGSDVATLQKLSTALACEAMLGREEMYRSSMHGQNNTGSMHRKKLDHIKTIVNSMYQICQRYSLKLSGRNAEGPYQNHRKPSILQ